MEVLLRPIFTIPSFTSTTPSPSPKPKSSYCKYSPFLPPQIQTPSKTLLSTSSRFLSPVRQAAQESQLSAEVKTDTREWAMQDFYTLRKDVEAASERVEDVRASTGLQQLEKELEDLESKTADSSFWDDRAKAQETLQALTDVKDKINLLIDFKTKIDDAVTIVKLTEEIDSIDAGLLEEAASIIKELNKALDRFELTQLLSGPYDKEGAVISITAGAGGTDAQSVIWVIIACLSKLVKLGD